MDTRVYSLKGVVREVPSQAHVSRGSCNAAAPRTLMSLKSGSDLGRVPGKAGRGEPGRGGGRKVPDKAFAWTKALMLVCVWCGQKSGMGHEELRWEQWGHVGG